MIRAFPGRKPNDRCSTKSLARADNNALMLSKKIRENRVKKVCDWSTWDSNAAWHLKLVFQQQLRGCCPPPRNPLATIIVGNTPPKSPSVESSCSSCCGLQSATEWLRHCGARESEILPRTRASFGALRRRRERDDDDREKRDDRDGRETPSPTLVKLRLTLLDAVWTSCSAGTSGSFSD